MPWGTRDCDRSWNGYSDVEVVGETFDEEEAVRMGGELQPQVAVMDINNGRITSTEHDVVQYHDIVVIDLSINARVENQTAMKKSGSLELA